MFTFMLTNPNRFFCGRVSRKPASTNVYSRSRVLNITFQGRSSPDQLTAPRVTVIRTICRRDTSKVIDIEVSISEITPVISELRKSHSSARGKISISYDASSSPSADRQSSAVETLRETLSNQFIGRQNDRILPLNGTTA